MQFYFSQGWTRVMVFAAALGAQACAISPMHRPGSAAYVARNTIMPAAGVVTVQNQGGYMSYHAGSLLDTQGYTFVRQARGEACQHGIGLPLGLVNDLIRMETIGLWASLDMRWGEGTLYKAMQQATSGMRSDEALVDLTIDQHKTSVLSVLYRQTCLVVQGRIMAPPGRAPSTPDRALEATPVLAPGTGLQTNL